MDLDGGQARGVVTAGAERDEISGLDRRERDRLVMRSLADSGVGRDGHGHGLAVEVTVVRAGPEDADRDRGVADGAHGAGEPMAAGVAVGRLGGCRGACVGRCGRNRRGGRHRRGRRRRYGRRRARVGGCEAGDREKRCGRDEKDQLVHGLLRSVRGTGLQGRWSWFACCTGSPSTRTVRRTCPERKKRARP